MRRLYFVFALWLVAMFPRPAAAITDGVAAVVNGKVITFSDVKRYVGESEQQLVDLGLRGEELVNRVKELRLDALRALIDRALIIQEWDSKGLTLPEKITDDRVDEIVRTNFGGDRAAFIRTLQAAGKTYEGFRREQKENIIVQAMTQKFVQEEVVISPYKIEQYYQKKASELRTDDEVKLRMIFLNPRFKEKRTQADGTTVEVDPQKVLAEELRAKLDAGADFADLARSFTEGTHKSDGGDWGWVSRKTLRKELAEVAFGMFPGQHSKVIETDNGYYIIKVEDSRKGRVPPLEEIRPEIEKMILVDERKARRDEWVNTLRQKAYIKMF
ncbi:MAG TPA: peptidyl-prolyl cis-trans isomerase [Verrucomicrobiae bacterium]|nr:peptidyl-prolyl cis-trans isomerase [Verrucomicrobiae bacterium]